MLRSERYREKAFLRNPDYTDRKLGRVVGLPADAALALPHLRHAMQNLSGVRVHVRWLATQRRRDDGGQARRLIPIDLRGGHAVPRAAGGLRTVHSGPHSITFK